MELQKKHHKRVLDKQFKARPSYMSIRRKHVHVDTRVANDQRLKIDNEVRQQRGIPGSSRTNADVFVSSDPTVIGQRCELIAIANGVLVMSPDYLLTQGTSGQAVSYLPGTEQARSIWASPAWVERHTTLFELLDHVINKAESKWSWFHGTIAEFRRQSARHGLNSRKFLGLVTPGDRRADQADQRLYLE